MLMTRFAIALSGIVLNTLLANLFLVRWLNCSIPVPLTLLNLSINIGILILLFYLIQHTQGNHQHTQALLQKSMDDLELRVAERTAELLKVNESLQHELEERKHTQEALQISQARFAGILDIADSAIISIDTQQRITLFNQGAEKIFGYATSEVLGQPLDILLPAQATQIYHQHIQTFAEPAIQSYRIGDRCEISGRRKDGSEFPAEASISKLVLGKEILFTVFLQDITERKQIDRMKDELVSMVSHELRTPLTSIQGSLGMLASGLLKADSEQGKRMLHIATESTDRLVRLINDILDIERIKSGRVKMEKELCNVNDLITTAVDIVQPLANTAGVTLSVASLPIQVWADRDRIVQTLTNLLSNAIKFSERGSAVWLKAELGIGEQSLEGREVDESISEGVDESVKPLPPNTASSHHPLHPSTPFLLFSVHDRGRGIPADQLETIFERLQQVDSSDSRNHEGTGLGLAICRSIVQQHEGRIWAESILGEGSTFYFTLPLSPPQTHSNKE
ncbi:MAG: sensor histidine kinase [Leptodesmis sp.]|uniref:sensor histidine kinase n=1 Tax=Leptodesmis sp. TaxID=3100501 RepID=UPI003D134438